VIIDYGGWCGVVVDQHFDLGLGECGLGNDLVAGGGSGEQQWPIRTSSSDLRELN
jgi:hypothetical protein